MKLIPRRLVLPAFAALLVALLGVSMLRVTPAEAAPAATKSCVATGESANSYTCTLTITPSVPSPSGSWLVQMVPGPGIFTGTSTVTSSIGCTSAPTIGVGSYISAQYGTADFDVVMSGGGCGPTAVVEVTEIVSMTTMGTLCQRVWVNTSSPFATACETFTPVSTPTPTPGTFAAPPMFSSGGIANSVFYGGTVAQLDTALRAVGAAGVWAQDGSGEFVLYIVDGGFVNGAFTAAFVTSLPDPSALTLVR